MIDLGVCTIVVTDQASAELAGAWVERELWRRLTFPAGSVATLSQAWQPGVGRE